VVNPFFAQQARSHLDAAFVLEEVRLTNRNHGLLLEALRYDVTPVGMHYLLNHFDVPALDEQHWRLTVAGRVERPLTLSLDDIRALPEKTLRVTLECAGNGRAGMAPRYPSMPWLQEGTGTADWTGTPLRNVLEQAGLREDVVEVGFFGADRGFDRGVEHAFGRSLQPAYALDDDVLLVYAMNGMPLLPQHGAPLRLIVPGWYGMASVKWLVGIEALDRPFDGYQQAVGYHYRTSAEDPGVPVTHIHVRSLIEPPGIPDWYTRQRLVDAGRVKLCGRAWSGAGVPVTRVEVGIDGTWHEASLEASPHRYAWRRWTFMWDAAAGDHELCVRATDANGAVQPLEAGWNVTGLGNNAVHRIQVSVREP
jgi:DMSO/TMAO reductase YedYZ molybdopterin-dependent catalytic subunit